MVPQDADEPHPLGQWGIICSSCSVHLDVQCMRICYVLCNDEVNTFIQRPLGTL